jgi:23S rRNA (cytidine1920-2'-O)/16S rRNA (cytidine1409-2'-O)-methyltransferase
VIAAARELDWHPHGLVASPITGPAGNHEYLLWLSTKPPEESGALGLDGGSLDPGWILALIKRTLAT